MELYEIRGQIDQIDDELAVLFARRMGLAADVAQVKRETGGAVLQPGRENEILRRLCTQADPQWHVWLRLLYATLFQVSRAYQDRLLAAEDSPLRRQIAEAVDRGRGGFPQGANLACQGIEGAYAHLAARQLFTQPNMIYLRSFDAVFRAVEQGLCRYGVLPIENSTYGSVLQVYDLLKRHHCSIVGGLRMPIVHCLLSRAKFLKDIKEIYSHEQALGQCGAFLDRLGERVTVTVCENTAVAARMAAQSGRADVAAISSEECAGLYGLEVLKRGIQDEPLNETRFIAIARQPEICAGANRSSVLLALKNQPGALASLLQLIAALEINLTKLESRPVPGRDFEFLFYLDMECDASKRETQVLLEGMARQSEEFLFLGSYLEE